MDESGTRVELRDVVRRFEGGAETVWAVRDTSMTVGPGEFVCLYGPSGSGKSTLLNLIAGLDVADSGDVRVGGVDLRTLDEDGRARLRLTTVGVVFQDHNLVEEFTAAENVALPLQARGVRRVDALREAGHALAKVGLEGLGRRFPHQLSGGQQQRVGVARALAGGRRILLADEPTGALDSAASADLYRLIRRLCDRGASAVVCSHDPDCRDHADSVYEVRDGRLTPQTALR